MNPKLKFNYKNNCLPLVNFVSVTCSPDTDDRTVKHAQQSIVWNKMISSSKKKLFNPWKEVAISNIEQPEDDPLDNYLSALKHMYITLHSEKQLIKFFFF